MALTPAQLSAALTLRDLTDPAHGLHAMQLLLAEIVGAVQRRWHVPVAVWRAPPVTTAVENYDALLYPLDGGARDERHTRWLDAHRLLRTQTSALVPAALRMLSEGELDAVLLVCPGLTWRRDRVDRLHCGEPHQLDLWLLSRTEQALSELISVVARAALPEHAVTTSEATHPYTTGGLQLDAGGLEIGECGVAARAVLGQAGLPGHHGLAMGLGLDRVLMLRKGIDDIRLLRSDDPRVAQQLLDLEPWRAISRQPTLSRDLSLALDPEVTLEELGDRVRAALGADADCIEDVSVVARTPAVELSEAARRRLGLREGQLNALVRVTMRHPTRSMTRAEADVLRERIWNALT